MIWDEIHTPLSDPSASSTIKSRPGHQVLYPAPQYMTRDSQKLSRDWEMGEVWPTPVISPCAACSWRLLLYRRTPQQNGENPWSPSSVPYFTIGHEGAIVELWHSWRRAHWKAYSQIVSMKKRRLWDPVLLLGQRWLGIAKYQGNSDGSSRWQGGKYCSQDVAAFPLLWSWPRRFHWSPLLIIASSSMED